MKKKIILKKVSIIKLSDDKFNNNHPNGINTGYKKSGVELVPPTIGEAYWVGNNWRTSTVIEIINKRIFKTLNSTYKITY